MSSGLKQQYEEQGYAIVRGAIDAGLAAETAGHVHWLTRKTLACARKSSSTTS